jgi:hypothetical protein
MKTEPIIKSARLILVLALTAAIVSPLDLVNLSQVQAQTSTPTNAATSLPNETQGTITFIAVSAATLILAVIAFAWILKQTKKTSQKRVQRTKT